MYIDSSKIKVFPTANRGQDSNNKTYNPESKLTSEDNLNSIVRRLVDNSRGNDGFVIEYENDTIKFCIDGYYFEVSDVSTSLFTTLTGEVYASIRVQDNEEITTLNTYNLPTLVNNDSVNSSLDANNVFKAVIFSDSTGIPSASQGNYVYTLKLFNSSHNVPKESYFKLKTEKVFKEINNVDYSLDDVFTESVVSESSAVGSAHLQVKDSIYAEKIGTFYSQSQIGDEINPIYVSADGTIVSTSSTVGAYNKPVYLNGGNITAFSSQIGDEGIPVYVNSNGELTQTSFQMTSNDSATYGYELLLYGSKGIMQPSYGFKIGDYGIPIYVDNWGQVKEMTSVSIGSEYSPVYFDSSLGFTPISSGVQPSNSNVGNYSIPTYLSNGKIVSLNSTIGSSITGVYLNGGVITSSPEIVRYAFRFSYINVATYYVWYKNLPGVIGDIDSNSMSNNLILELGDMILEHSGTSVYPEIVVLKENTKMSVYCLSNGTIISLPYQSGTGTTTYTTISNQIIWN